MARAKIIHKSILSTNTAVIDNTDLTGTVYRLNHNLGRPPILIINDNNGVEIGKSQISVDNSNPNYTDIDFGDSITGNWTIQYS